MRSALTALLRTPAVTVASVSGACLGGGAEIAAACDFVLASEDARIGFPEIELACFPPGAVALLSERVGPARAAEWILGGKAFSGSAAAAAGFASRAVPFARLAEETRALAGALASRSEAALSAVLPLLRRGRLEAVAQVLPRAEEAYRGLAGDAELARAVRDFPRRRRT
jgi:cyclohexa-1,5-dienecarbonyl-CoA hydratase